MKSKSISKVFVALALVVVALSITSCNRGYGCPYELEAAVQILSPVFK
jgi:hypothetical protein